MRNLTGTEHPATKAVWAGEEGYLVERATQVPIVQSIPFGYDDLDEWEGVALGEREGHIYSRNTNPTTRAFEEKVRVLEGAEDSTSFATGMAAISNTLFAFLKPGDRVVSVKDTYGGTNKIFLEFLPRAGVEVTLLRHHGPRRHRRGGRQGMRPAVPGDADEPDAQVGGHRAPFGGRARGRRHRRGGRHLRDAHKPEPDRPRAPTSCSTAPPSTSAGTLTRSAGSCAGRASSCGGCTTTGRSTAPRSTPSPPTCCFAA